MGGPRHMRWLRIELAILWFIERRSIHSATPARACFFQVVYMQQQISPFLALEVIGCTSWQFPHRQGGATFFRKKGHRWGGLESDTGASNSAKKRRWQDASRRKWRHGCQRTPSDFGQRGGWGWSMRADIYSPSPLNRTQKCYLK